MTDHREHRATIIAHNEQADAARKLELWFFRDMNDEQRLKLLSLFGLAVKGSETQGAQKLALRRIISAMAPLYVAPVAAEPLFREGCAYTSTSGRVCIKCGHVHTETTLAAPISAAAQNEVLAAVQAVYQSARLPSGRARSRWMQIPAWVFSQCERVLHDRAKENGDVR